MQVVRVIVWVALLSALVIFSWANWDPLMRVNIWPGLVWETRLPAVVVVAFLIGLVPLWLLHLVTKWRLRQRIGRLEATARQATPVSVADPVTTPAEHPGPPPVP